MQSMIDLLRTAPSSWNIIHCDSILPSSTPQRQTGSCFIFFNQFLSITEITNVVLYVVDETSDHTTEYDSKSTTPAPNRATLTPPGDDISIDQDMLTSSAGS